MIGLGKVKGRMIGQRLNIRFRDHYRRNYLEPHRKLFDRLYIQFWEELEVS